MIYTTDILEGKKMSKTAKLKDYLGSLVKDLNAARYTADLESARIAELYANDPILKNFSVPRMKILDTELTIPIAVDSLDESTDTEYNPIDNKKAYSFIYSEIKNVIETKSFRTAVSQNLRQSIYKKIDQLEQEVKGGEDTVKSITKFADDIAKTSLDQVKNDIKESEKFNNRLNKIGKKNSTDTNDPRELELKNLLVANLKKYLVQVVKPPKKIVKFENANIFAESEQLKNYSPQNIVYIKMKVTEESMEWQTMVDDDGNVVPKLMPE